MSQDIQRLETGPGQYLQPIDAEFTDIAEKGLSRLVRVGLWSIAVLVFGIGGLLAFLPMAGAVIAPGEVTVETHVKELSHPFGGVASDILVKDGEHVRKGQVLIRLDDTVSGAAAQYTGLSLDQLLARSARLRAMLGGASAIAFPQELMARASDPMVRMAMEDERKALVFSRQLRSDQVRQLQARIAQTRAEISTAASRATAYGQQERLVQQELEQTRELYEGRLTTLDRLNALERAAVGVQSDRAAALANVIESGARIGELQAQMATVMSGSRNEAAVELSQVESMIADLRKQSVAASDQSDRTAIRAPQDGIVDKLTIRTIGAVVPAGQKLLEIVPDKDRLVIKVQIRPTDIDQVVTGQPAHLRFSALNQRTTPELRGKVVQVSADRMTEQATGATYFTAIIALPESEFRKLNNARLSVGMPVEAFIQTEQRTILEYIVRPISDQLRRALLE